MISEPEIVDVPAQTVAYIHVTVPRAEIMQAMHAGLDELSAALKAQKVAPTGPWFTHHLRRPNETFDFRICFPVNSMVNHEGRVYGGEVAQARVVRTVYSGDYSGLPAAWGELMAWIENNSYETRADLWERYLVGPETTVRAEEWQTELNRPLA
jgi:effector-binding domain-containing protein